MIARLTLWDSIGASRDPLDVFPVRLAPASPPGLSLIPCASAGAEPGGKCGVGQLATVPSAAAVLWQVSTRPLESRGGSGR